MGLVDVDAELAADPAAVGAVANATGCGVVDFAGVDCSLALGKVADEAWRIEALILIDVGSAGSSESVVAVDIVDVDGAVVAIGAAAADVAAVAVAVAAADVAVAAAVAADVAAVVATDLAAFVRIEVAIGVAATAGVSNVVGVACIAESADVADVAAAFAAV